MAGWITYDYKCVECQLVFTKMSRRDAVPEIVPCEDTECGGSAGKTMNINITTVSHVDGNDRWKYVKEQRKLEMMKREATKSGNAGEVARIESEKKVVKEHSRRDKKSEAPCKRGEQK